MRRALLLLLLLWPAGAFAQSAFDEMRSNLEQGYYAIAAQVLGPNLIQNYPESADAHFLYAQALYLTGNPEAAREALERALELAPEAPPEYERLRGLLLAAEGNAEEAASLLRSAFEVSQDYATALDWGRIAWQAGDYEQALEAFSAAAATDAGQRDLWAQLNRGRILKAQKRYPEAIEAFNQAIATFEANDPGDNLPSPGYVEAFFRLGEIYEAMGELGQARSFYEAARSADPNYSPAISALERLGP